MKLLKTIIAICFCVILSFDAMSAYNITGKIVSVTDGEPIVGVNVSLKKDSVNVVFQTQTSVNGTFSFEKVEEPDVSVVVESPGFDKWSTMISGNANNLDLGIIKLSNAGIKLGEVVVEGAGIYQKANRYVVIPSQQELERAAEVMNLMSEMAVKLPGLRVNEITRSITVDGGAPVVQVNGREQPLSKVLNLNHNDILRIEYSDSPDIRYANSGASGIINFIMKPTQQGGSIMARLNSAVTTNRNNGQLNATYNYKKSEWTFNYGGMFRKSKDEITNITETFIGRENPVVREQEGQPSKTKDFDNNFSLDYVYMHDPQTMLAATLSYNYHDNERDGNYRMIERYGAESEEYNKLFHYYYTRNTPSLGLYFRKAFQHNQRIEITANSSMSKGDYTRGLDYTTDFESESFTDNQSWVAGGEAMYAREFKNLTMRFGASYVHNYADNGYSENGNRQISDKLGKDNVYVYGDISGNLQKLGYAVGVGMKYLRSSDFSMSKSFVKPKATVSLNYPFNKHFTANYMYMFDSSLPSLSNFSEIVRTVDDLIVQTGNVNVKPGEWFRNRFYIRYNTGNFYATGEVNYNYTNNPIVQQYQYISDQNSPYYDKFMSKVENGDFDKQLNLQLYLGYQNLFDHITIYGTVGWDKFNAAGRGYAAKKSAMYSSVSMNVYWGGWTLFANVDIVPRYSIYGTSLYKSWTYNYIGARYKWKNWNFECNINNPFVKRGSFQKTWNTTPAYTSYEEMCIRDFNNMVSLTVQYRINLGKAFKKAGRSLRGNRIDTGVDVNY